MSQDVVHNRILIEGSLNVEPSLPQQSEELNDQTLGLCVIEYSGVFVGGKDESKLRVDNVLDFADVEVVVDVLDLEAEFQVLIGKDTDMSLGIVSENFDHSAWVQEVVLEENR
jgi:hypothetical protein